VEYVKQIKEENIFEKVIFNLAYNYHNLNISWLEVQPYTKLLRLNDEFSKISERIRKTRD
jgi:hypothetical protein